jgi:hypothetical protein
MSAICALLSPTDRPPMAIPSNGRAAMASTLCRRSSGSTPPCTIPNSAWSGRVRAARQRSAQRWVRAIASPTRAAGRVASTSWSNAIAISPPRASWISTARSGVRRCADPSRWLAKVTPSSSTRLRWARLKTWYPPESVRIGPSQPMNRCSPPSRAIRSWPGRSDRWYVLARMIWAPAVRRSPGVRLLTVACVPTGMNCGVSIVPCGVVNLPMRARPLLVDREVNEVGGLTLDPA